MKFHEIVVITLCVILVSLLPVFAGENDSGFSSYKDLNMVPKEGEEGQWEFINQNGDIIGTAITHERRQFKIYDRNGVYIGYVNYVHKKGIWGLANANRARELYVKPEHVKLYLAVLINRGIVDLTPDELTLKPKANAEDKWEIENQAGNSVGTLERGEINFRLYDKDHTFWGYIRPEGSWNPKYGGNDIDEVSPEMAKLFLDVSNALPSIE